MGPEVAAELIVNGPQPHYGGAENRHDEQNQHRDQKRDAVGGVQALGGARHAAPFHSPGPSFEAGFTLVAMSVTAPILLTIAGFMMRDCT
jgi:hypothetical protein